MEIKDIIALVIGAVIIVIFAAYMFVNEKKNIIEWLKYAVAEAEKALGGGTGQLKLRLVYEWFVTQFPVISAVVPFKVFSSWVDIALETFDKWLSNTKFVEYIGYEGGSKHGSVHK